MSCVEKYYAPNGKESLLHKELVKEVGQWRAGEIYLMTDSDNFKNWFGDWRNGKVPKESLDENGDPLLLWHGSNTDRITYFREGNNFFSKSKQIAEERGKEVVAEKGGKLNVYPVFIRMTETMLNDRDITVMQDQVKVNRDVNESIKSIYNNGMFSSSQEIYEQSDHKLTRQEIENMMLESSSKITAATNDTPYTLGTFKLRRVSHVVDTDGGIPFRGDKSGTKYLEEGTRYHKMVQLIIEGNTNEEISNQLSDGQVDESEEFFIRNMRDFVQRLRKTGTVMSEIRVANVDRGIAGTIDILHIKDEGKVDIYDLKTAHETEWKRNVPHGEKMSTDIWDIADFNYYKAERYSLQTSLYSVLLENPDLTTGRRALEVENVFVIPVEVARGDDDNVTGIQNLKPENIRGWSAGSKSFYKWSRKLAKSIIEGKPRKSQIIGKNSEGVDVGDHLRQALGIEGLEIGNVKARATRIVDNAGGSNTFAFGDVRGISWVSNDKEDRVNQVAALIIRQDENHAAEMTSGIDIYFNTEYKGLEGGARNFTDKAPNPNTRARTSRLSKVLSSAGAKGIIKLSTIPGFSSYQDVVLVKRSDGTYDLLTFSNINHDEEFDIKNKEGNLISTGMLRKSDSILGNHMTPYESRRNGITLSNNYGDFSRLRLAIVGLEVMKQNPSMKINRIIVDQMVQRTDVSPKSPLLSEIIPQLKVMASIDNIKNVLPNEILDIINDMAETPVNASDDPLTDLHNYLSQELTESIGDKLSKQIERYKKSELTKDALADEILNGVGGIRGLIARNYRSTTPQKLREDISSDSNFILLARTWLDLKRITLHPEKDVTDEFFGQISQFFKSPTATGRKTLDKFFDIFRQHYDNVKTEVDKFQKFKDPYFRNLINDDPLVKRGIPTSFGNLGGSDVITAMGRSVMEPLIVKKKDAKGNIILTPFLIPEGSPEFKKLNLSQRQVIKMFNDSVEKYFPGKWVRGQIPIIKVSSDSLIYKSKLKLSQGKVGESAVSAKEALSTYWSMVANKGNFVTGDKAEKQFGDEMYDAFSHQVSAGDGEFTADALKRIGLDKDMNLIDADKNREMEFDLERVITMFTSHYMKKEEMDKALPVYHLFRSIFKYYELAHGFVQPNTIKMMDEYVADLAFNVKQGEDELVSKVVNASIRLSSIALIGLNWKVFVGNTIQMGLAGVTDSIVNSITNDPRFAGVKDWGRATFVMGQAMKDPAEMMKLMLIRQKYLKDDLGVLTGAKYQVTARGMINEQLAYTFDRSMELGVRTHHILAQMMKDGTYDAHRAERFKGEDGYDRWRLVYDPKKDPRFKGEEGQAFYNALKNSMEEKGELDETGEITGAYDWHLRERLKSYINRGIGSFDRDLSSPWARHSLLFAFSQFRNWFTNKYIRSTKLEYDAEIFGDWTKTNDGKFVWSTEPMKGILWTMSEMHQLIPKLIKGGTKAISREDYKNIVYMGTSLVAWTAMYLSVAAIWADDDDEEFKDLKALAENAMSENMNWLTLKPFASIMLTPSVFASYYERLFGTLGKVIMHGAEGNGAEMWNNAVSVLPGINKLPDSFIEVETND